MPKHALFTEGSGGGKHRLVNELVDGGQHKFYSASTPPSFRSFTSANFSQTTTAVLTAPTGMAVGDTLLVIIEQQNVGATNTLSTTGWTRVEPTGHFFSASGFRDVYGELWVKTATSGDLSASVTVTSSASQQGQAVYVAYAGGTDTPIVDNTYFAYNGTGTTSLDRTQGGPPSWSGGTQRCVTVWLAVNNDGSTTSPTVTCPGGLTERVNVSAIGSNRVSSLVFADELLTGVPSSQTASSTSSENMTALTFTLTNAP